MGENWEPARTNNLHGFFLLKGREMKGACGAKESVCVFKIDGIIVLVC